MVADTSSHENALVASADPATGRVHELAPARTVSDTGETLAGVERSIIGSTCATGSAAGSTVGAVLDGASLGDANTPHAEGGSATRARELAGQDVKVGPTSSDESSAVTRAAHSSVDLQREAAAKHKQESTGTLPEALITSSESSTSSQSQAAAQAAASGASATAAAGACARPSATKKSPRLGPLAGRKSPKRSTGGRGPAGRPGSGAGRGRGRGRGNLAAGGLVAGPILRHNKTMYTYGNYDQYYRQRHDRCATVDPRVEALLRARGPELFSGKAILDMGCNAGFVTLLIAALGATRVEGVDIDTKLVGLALRQLRRLKQEGHRTFPVAAGSVAEDLRFPVSLVQCRGIVPYAMKPLVTKPLSSPECGQGASANLAVPTSSIAPVAAPMTAPLAEHPTPVPAAVPADTQAAMPAALPVVPDGVPSAMCPRAVLSRATPSASATPSVLPPAHESFAPQDSSPHNLPLHVALPSSQAPVLAAGPAPEATAPGPPAAHPLPQSVDATPSERRVEVSASETEPATTPASAAARTEQLAGAVRPSSAAPLEAPVPAEAASEGPPESAAPSPSTACDTAPAAALSCLEPTGPVETPQGPPLERRASGIIEDGLPPVFPYNVEFRTENVLVSEVEDRRGLPYDVVLCLKLTKWVHLYWGDDGLKVLFHKCFRLLKPGGVLILEAQEWQSYQSSKQLTPHMKQNKTLLRLQPQEFTTYLVHVIGFSPPETVAGDPPLKRPLLLFRRPETPVAVDPAQQAADRLLDGTQVVKAVLSALARAKEAGTGVAPVTTLAEGRATPAAAMGAVADTTVASSDSTPAPGQTAPTPAPASLQPEGAPAGAGVAVPPAVGGGAGAAGGAPAEPRGRTGSPSAMRFADVASDAQDKTGETVPDSSTLPEGPSEGATLEENDGHASSISTRTDSDAPPAKRLRAAE